MLIPLIDKMFLYLRKILSNDIDYRLELSSERKRKRGKDKVGRESHYCLWHSNISGG